MKKSDKEKLDNFVDRQVDAYKYCFNEEYTNKYLVRFSETRAESARYNNDFGKLHLSILNEIDVSEEIPKELEKEVKEIKEYFAKEFRKKMKQILPTYFEELKKSKKAEKEKESELKGKGRSKK